MGRRRKKRTLTPEQIQKMQDGRKKAQESIQRDANYKKQVAMLSELEDRLKEGAKGSKPVRMPSRRRRHF